MKSDADPEKALAEIRKRQRAAALDREIAMQALGNLLTAGGKGDRHGIHGIHLTYHRQSK